MMEAQIGCDLGHEGIERGCKFARNSDPLRGIFASNSDPF